MTEEIFAPDTQSEKSTESPKKPFNVKKRIVCAVVFVAAVAAVCVSFDLGFSLGRVGMAKKSNYEEIIAERDALKKENGAQRAEIKKYEALIEPYKELSSAEIEAQIAATKLKTEQDEEALNAIIAAEQAEAVKAAIAEAEEEAAKFEEEYDTGITYDMLARYPSTYISKKVKLSGKVVQVMEGLTSTEIRLAVGKNYDDILYCVLPKNLTENYRILENDTITVYGVSKGLYTYTSTFGASITIPSVSVDRWY